VTTSPVVIGQNIRTARVARKWTQRQLAELIGVESQTISNLERGLYGPSWRTLGRLAEALGISEGELFSEDGVAA
jgi:transcriptional regulator with XRE-family HTH domain